MKKLAVLGLSFLLSCLVVAPSTHLLGAEVATPATTGRTFYVSSTQGNDANDGLSEERAFQSLGKINELTLAPGDTVKLQNGSVFQNQFLHIQGSGNETHPIRITNYGNENLALPTIHTNGRGTWFQDYGTRLDDTNHKYRGDVSSSILLKDVEYIEISNLAMTNAGADGNKAYNAVDFINRTGVAVVSQNKGTLDHIYLDSLRITNVQGNVYDKHMNNGGIYFTTFLPANENETGIARYNDVRITNSYLENVNRWGIAVAYTAYWNRFTNTAIPDEVSERYGSTNVVIENNFLKNVGGDAITTMYAHRPLVQNNVSVAAAKQINDRDYAHSRRGKVAAAIWPWKCKDAIFQYNEAYDTHFNQDGQAWDADSGDGTIYQYNYSHNNEGGTVMFCWPQAYRNTFRYNISYRDLAGILSPSSNPDANIYNNTFIVAEGVDLIRSNQARGNYRFENNILYYTGNSPKRENWNKEGTTATYARNLYYNYENIPNDPYAVRENPQFLGDISTAPTAPQGERIRPRAHFEMFKLAENSPAIDKGLRQTDHSTVDFFGVTVGNLPDLGASETTYPRSPLMLASAVYRVLGDTVSQVPKRSLVSAVKASVSFTQGATLAIVDEHGQEKQDTDTIKRTDKFVLTKDDQRREYNIVLGKTYEEYDPSTLQVEVGSYQRGNQTEGDGTKALDNRLDTMWHTKWDGDRPENLWITLNLGSVKEVSMFKYVPRITIANGIITKYEILVSDDNQTWRSVALGNWERDTSTKIVEFASTQAQYVRLKAIESYSKIANKRFASAAEVRTGIEILEEGEVRLDGNNQILASAYQMQDRTIYVPALEANPTSVEEFRNALSLPERASFKVVDRSGATVTDSIANGHIARVTAENGEIQDYTIQIKNTYQWVLDYVNEQQGNVWFAQKKYDQVYENLTSYDGQWPNWTGSHYGSVGIDAPNHSALPTEAMHGLLSDALQPNDARSQGYSMVYRVPKDGTVTFRVKDDEPYLRHNGNTGGSVKLSLTHNGTELVSSTLEQSRVAVPLAPQRIQVRKGDYLRVEAKNIGNPTRFSVHVTPIVQYENVAVNRPDENPNTDTSPTENTALQDAKREALEALVTAYNRKTVEIGNSALTLEEKTEKTEALNAKVEAAEQAINEAASVEDVQRAKEAGLQSLEIVVIGESQAKADARQAIEQANTAKLEAINNSSLTNEEKDAKRQALEPLKTNAINGVNNADSNEEVSTAKNQGVQAIQDLAVGESQAKTDARQAVQSAYSLKLQAINEITPALTTEEKAERVGQLDEAKVSALSNIDQATSNETVSTAKTQGLTAINNVASTESAEKADARALVEETYNSKLEEINNANLTESEKQEKRSALGNVKDQALQSVNNAIDRASVANATETGMQAIQTFEVGSRPTENPPSDNNGGATDNNSGTGTPSDNNGGATDNNSGTGTPSDNNGGATDNNAGTGNTDGGTSGTPSDNNGGATDNNSGTGTPSDNTGGTTDNNTGGATDNNTGTVEQPNTPTETTENKVFVVSENGTEKGMVRSETALPNHSLHIEQSNVGAQPNREVYDIYFTEKGNPTNRVTVPNGNYEVRLRRRTVGEVSGVVHLDNSGNVVERFANYRTEGEFVVFNTTHFSLYAIEYASAKPNITLPDFVYKAWNYVTTGTTEPVKDKVPNTSASSALVGLWVLVGAGLLAMKKRK